MALLPYSAQPTSTSQFPSHGNENIVPNADPSHPQFINHHRATKDTFHNRTALNRNRMSPVVEALRKYANGYRIKVTWYSFMHNFSDKRSVYSAYTHILDRVHKAYKKVIDLELVLSGPMDFSYDTDLVETTVEGTCKLQGGIDAHVGDIFLYEKYPGQYGLFVVNNKERLSDSTGSFQDVSFTLKEFPSNETLARLEDCVLETYYYTEIASLGKKSVVVERSDYVNQINLLQLRKELITYYTDQFFSLDTRTFIRPDNVYDPYVVQFMRKIMSFDDHRYYPPNLIIKPKKYEQSIWSLLELGQTRFQTICTTYTKSPITSSVFGVLTSPLTGMKLAELDIDSELPYVLSDNEYRILLGKPLEDLEPTPTKVEINIVDPTSITEISFMLDGTIHTINDPELMTAFDLVTLLTTINNNLPVGVSGDIEHGFIVLTDALGRTFSDQVFEILLVNGDIDELSTITVIDTTPDGDLPDDVSDTLRFLYAFLNEGTVNVSLLEKIDTWCTDINHQFYCIPLAIHAINRSLL